MNKREHRDFKSQLYEQFACIGKALSNPHRLELLDLLAQGERTVEQLAQAAERPVANTSQHLQVLRRARLVEVRRSGLYAHYRLADEGAFRLWQSLRDLGQRRLAEVERVVQTYLGERERMQAVSPTELRKLMRNGDVIVLDVRPAEEYRAGHIPGARSVPVDELRSRLQELPASQEIVAYCRGPYCVFADEAVALLNQHGYRARRLDRGLPDWRALALPVEQS